MPRNQIKPIPELTQTEIERFWSHVDVREADECWPYSPIVHGAKYGRFHARGNTFGAHRVAYRLHYGSDPYPETLHSCGNHPCCNFAHLSAGTELENAADRERHGRTVRGDSHPWKLYPWLAANAHKATRKIPPERRMRGDNHWTRLFPESVIRGESQHLSKLTESNVLEIRSMFASGGYTQRELGRMFSVSQFAIYAIIKRRTWKHI